MVPKDRKYKNKNQSKNHTTLPVNVPLRGADKLHSVVVAPTGAIGNRHGVGNELRAR